MASILLLNHCLFNNFLKQFQTDTSMIVGTEDERTILDKTTIFSGAASQAARHRPGPGLPQHFARQYFG